MKPDRPEVGRLHVITDASLQSRFSHEELGRLAARGGADTVQYREKRALDTKTLVRTARELCDTLRPLRIAVIVNDRADVAAACGAAGVHLGRQDLEPTAARALLGPGCLIGATAHTLEQALEAERREVDYLGVGAVFGTASKSHPAPALGLAGLARVVAAVRTPVVAIGNITPERVPAVLAAGAHGVAVLSAVARSEDPAGAVARLREAIERFREGETRVESSSRDV